MFGSEKKNFLLRCASIFWNGFIKTIPWLGKCLSWKVGNGHDIVIGSDLVIGSSSCLFFNQDFRSYLRDYGILTLQHAQNPFTDSQSYWITVDDLELGGEWRSV